MPRPSKLSPEQWREVARRHASGEGVRALAREFGIDESSVRAKVNPQTPQVRAVAQKLADAQTSLAALPVPQQYAAVSLADKLRNISASLASAAELGSATAHRLHALANSEVAKVDDAEPMASLDSLRNIGVLTKLANDSSHIALNLLAANKARVEKMEDAWALKAASEMSDDELALIAARG
jgi:Helix-turn-helix domain of resolvase